MGNTASLSLDDIRGGASVVQARLRSGARCPNKEMMFAEDCGPLPRWCMCSPLGYAILSANMALMDVLIASGAYVNKPVGLPHRFSLTPLHLAAALGNAEATRKLLSHGADPNAMLRLNSGATAPAVGSVALLSRVNFTSTQPGDAPLHVAIDCMATARMGNGTEVVEALIGHDRTNPNQPNASKRTPLFKACERGLAACVTLLATHPRVDVNASGPLVAAIAAENSELVRVLLQAGADATGAAVRDDQGQSPLWHTLSRRSLFFRNRAEIVALLVDAGARVERDMVELAERRGWPRVLAALRAGEARQAAEVRRAAAAASGGRNGVAAGGDRGDGGPAVAEAGAEAGQAAGAAQRPPQARRGAMLLPVRAPIAMLGSLAGVLRGAVVGRRSGAGGDDSEGARLREGVSEAGGGLNASAVRRDSAGVGGSGLAAGSSDSTASEIGGMVDAAPAVVAAPGGDPSLPTAPTWDAAAGGDTGGLDGLCCVCMSERATRGFVHSDVVHCCLCEQCEGEMRRRGQLRRCLICKRPALALTRVVVT